MKNVPLGEIIAERHLEAKDEMGEEREIVVRIGKPIPAPFPDPRESDTWCCPCEIVGFADHYLYATCGADSVQALVLGLQRIVIELNKQQKAEKLKLTWGGWENLNFTVHSSEEDFNAYLMSEKYINELIALRDSEKHINELIALGDAELRSDG